MQEKQLYAEMLLPVMRLVLRSGGKPGPTAGTQPSADAHTAQQDRLLLLKEVHYLQSLLWSPQL